MFFAVTLEDVKTQVTAIAKRKSRPWISIKKKGKSESKPHGETLRNASTKQDTARKREAHQGIDRECLRPLNWPNHND